ncbi:N-acetylneuraminate synthase family protein [Staphylococcus saprophyticus]
MQSIKDKEHCYIIGEIGINHNGNMGLAKDMIKMAKESGCDAVKFQKRTIDKVYSFEELEKKRESIFGDTNRDLKKGLEFNKEEYKVLMEYCKELKIDFFASPWDCQSIDFLEDLGIIGYKVASAKLTDTELLKKIKNTKKPIILSTGMSSWDEVCEAINVLGEKNISAILACTSTYPTKTEETNISRIDTLKDNFDIAIGYSGHEKGYIPTIGAVAKGAVVIERHITLSRKMWGSDQHSSLEPDELKEMISAIREMELALGDGKIHIFDSEKPIKEKLRG